MARHTPGNYVPLDVNYARDLAIRKAGTNAELLFIRSLAYAKGARTSGFVSDFDIEVVAVGMRAVKAAAEKLVEVGLWVRVAEGWQVRSWDRWNSGTEAVSAGGKLGNHKRWHAERGVVDPDCDLCNDRGGIAPDIAPESPPASGSESQGKGREGKEKTTSSLARKRAERIDEDFKPSAEVAAWSQQQGFTPGQVQTLIAEFIDYWRAAGGKNAAKLDWDATFRNWVRRADSSRVRETTVLPTGPRELTGDQLNNILGPDHWTLPRPPYDLSPVEELEWEQRVRREHLAERQAQARARMGRAS